MLRKNIFRDDTVKEYREELTTDPRRFFTTSFERAINSTYLTKKEGIVVLISAAYLDHFLNETGYETIHSHEKDAINISHFKSLHPNLIVSHLKPIARLALAVVLGARSELNEQEKDNEENHLKWRASIQDLILRFT